MLSLILLQERCQEGRRNDARSDPLLPECARGIDRISKLRAVLPRRPQWDQARVPFNRRKRTSKLGGTIYLQTPCLENDANESEKS